MLSWLAANIGTLLVAAVLVAVIVLIVISLIRDKKNHKSTCGSNCAHCPSAGVCHKK